MISKDFGKGLVRARASAGLSAGTSDCILHHVSFGSPAEMAGEITATSYRNTLNFMSFLL